MKSKKLQELVKSIFTDEKIKSQFTSDPEGVLSKFSLTEDEKKAVLSIHARLGLITSDSTQLEADVKPTIWWFSPTP